jgi:hypothetical protein
VLKRLIPKVLPNLPTQFGFSWCVAAEYNDIRTHAKRINRALAHSAEFELTYLAVDRVFKVERSFFLLCIE